MANNLRKFQTESEYSSATLVTPAVSWVVATDTVHFDKTTPTPPTPTTFSGLTVTYDIADTSSPTQLFKGGGSGSGSGAGGVLPSSMIIDGTEVEVTNTYQFSTAGMHIVNYSFADNQIPKQFLSKIYDLAKAEIGDAITSIGEMAFYCCGFGSVTIGNSVTSIGESAFNQCTSLTSIDIPNSVTSISGSAFHNCTGLTSVTIGSGVTSIGEDAFYGCSSLGSIISNAMTAPTLGGSDVFNAINNNGVLTVPSGSQGYCDWMGNLPSYWTIQGVTCE